VGCPARLSVARSTFYVSVRDRSGIVGCSGFPPTSSGRRSIAAESRPATARSPAAWGPSRSMLRINGQGASDFASTPRTTRCSIALREACALTGNEEGLRPRPMRRLHRALERPEGQLLSEPRGDARRRVDHHESRASGTPDALNPMQAAYRHCDAISAATAPRARSCRRWRCSRRPCGPADGDVKELMSGNICRCGGLSEHRRRHPAVRRTA